MPGCSCRRCESSTESNGDGEHNFCLDEHGQDFRPADRETAYSRGRKTPGHFDYSDWSDAQSLILK